MPFLSLCPLRPLRLINILEIFYLIFCLFSLFLLCLVWVFSQTGFVYYIMKKLFTSIVAATAIASQFVYTHAVDAFYLKDGDRVVFYGDSITDQRLYTTFAETFVVTRFPDMDISFVHSGWGGDRVSGGGGGNIDTRLDRDVFAYDPTVMTIMLGMNDGSYRSFEQGIFDTYKNGLESIVTKTENKIPGIRITLIQPSPYDDVTRNPNFDGGYNAVLLRFSEAVRDIAKKHNQLTADLNTPVVAMLEKAKATDAKLSEKIIGDRVHPGPSGQLIMAECLLRAWDAPAIVSEVSLDVSDGKVTVAKVDNTKISDATAGDIISWKQFDKALPMPINMNDAETVLAVNSSDFVEKLNQQPLRVSGLKAPYYELSIDGESMGTFTKEEFASGINLTTLPTPMLKQATEVHRLTLLRADIHNYRWRNVQVPYDNLSGKIADQLKDTIKALDDADASAAKMQRTAAKPAVHTFTLVPRNEVLTTFGPSAPKLPAGLDENLALNKKWTSDSANTYGWDSGLTDGSWVSGHGTTFATNDVKKFPKNVTIDLGQVYPVAHIVIGVPPFGSTKTVAVSISEDENRFSEIGRHEFSIRKEEKYLFNFAPQKARYVRLTYVDVHSEHADYDPAFTFTTDVQVFAPAKK